MTRQCSLLDSETGRRKGDGEITDFIGGPFSTPARHRQARMPIFARIDLNDQDRQVNDSSLIEKQRVSRFGSRIDSRGRPYLLSLDYSLRYGVRREKSIS